MDILSQIIESLQGGDNSRVAALTQQALADHIPPKTILNDGLIAGMTVIGDRFKKREIFLPDVLLAARAMYAG